MSEDMLDNIPSTELHDTGQNHGLPVLQRARRHRGRPRVGDIVGTDVVGIKEGKDSAKGEQVIELMEGHLVDARMYLSYVLSLQLANKIEPTFP